VGMTVENKVKIMPLKIEIATTIDSAKPIRFESPHRFGFLKR